MATAEATCVRAASGSKDVSDDPTSSPHPLRSLVADNNYYLLKKSLLPGLGRPCSLPSKVELTNRTLLQLVVLQSEGNKSYKDVAGWFKDLFPDVAYPSSRLSGMLDRLVKKTQEKQEGADLPTFLDMTVDFDFVSSSLSKLGIKRGQLLQKVGWVPAEVEPEVLTNEIVIDLEHFRIQLKNKAQDKFVCHWIRKLSKKHQSATDYILKKSITKVMEGYTAARIKKQPENVTALMSAPFDTVEGQQRQSLTSAGVSSRLKTTIRELDKATKEIRVLTKQNVILQEREQNLSEKVATTAQACRELSSEKMSLINEMKLTINDKTQLEAQVVQLRETTAAQQQQIRLLKPTRFAQMQGKLKQSRKTLRNTKSGLAIAKLRLHEVSCQRQTLRATHSKMKRKFNDMVTENVSLKDQFQLLQLQLLQEQKDNATQQPATRVGHRNQFSDDVRRTVLELQGEGNVAASKCNFVIRTVADHLFGTPITEKELPCTSSSLNIADEGHFLTKFHASEKISESSNVTLHTDGTSRQGQKIVGFQVSLDSGETLNLGYTTVATEDSATLLDITIKLWEEMNEVFSTFEEMSAEEKDQAFKSLLSKITSTMTDRAAVMKAFDKKLLEFLQSQVGQDMSVQFLHCNAHCLLGFSRACEMALKSLEKETIQNTGEGFGRDKDPRFKRFGAAENATSRLIRTVSAICGPRGDDKNGCRADWLAFCDHMGVKTRLTSYRSNRFNSFFLGAAALIHHLQDLHSYLQDGYLSHNNLLIDSVRIDLQDDNLLSLVCAVAILYLRVTGPYWQLLESSVKYTDFHRYIQMMEACMARWREDTSELLDPQFVGIFNGEFEVDSPTKNKVCSFAEAHSGAVVDAIQKMFRDMLQTVRTQLQAFLPNGLFGSQSSPEIEEILKHCPVTNLIGENAFGDMDFDMNKRRHASFHHRSTTQMWKHNKTGKWLSGKEEEDQIKLMSLARKHGKSLRIQHKEQERLVMLNIREKILENQRLQRLKEANAAERKMTIIQSVRAHGGPCETKDDVPKLKTKLKKAGKKPGALKNALKDEIRYQKLVLGNKGLLRLGGTLADLTCCLQQHLPEQPEEPAAPASTVDPDEPQPKRRCLDTTASQPEHTADTSSSAFDGAADTISADEPFTYTAQGQWVATYYNEKFYVGQVIEVSSPQQGVVKYLEQTNARKDSFRWPTVNDVAVTDAEYIFEWDFEVFPANRLWIVPDVDDLEGKFNRIRRRSQQQ